MVSAVCFELELLQRHCSDASEVVKHLGLYRLTVLLVGHPAYLGWLLERAFPLLKVHFWELKVAALNQIELLTLPFLITAILADPAPGSWRIGDRVGELYCLGVVAHKRVLVIANL